MKNLDKILNEELNIDEAFGSKLTDGIKKGFNTLRGQNDDGAITTADASINTSTDTTNKDKKVNDVIKYKKQIVNYLYKLIYSFENAKGENEEEKKQGEYSKLQSKIVDIVKYIKSKNASNIETWEDIVKLIDSPESNLKKLKTYYDELAPKFGYSKAFVSTSQTKDPVDAWVEILNKPNELDRYSGSVAKDLKKFVSIFKESTFIQKMALSLVEGLDLSVNEDDDETFREAVRFVKMYKDKNSDVGKILRKWKPAEERINKYYDKLSDERKKQFNDAISGKTSKETEVKDSTDNKESDNKNTETDQKTNREYTIEDQIKATQKLSATHKSHDVKVLKYFGKLVFEYYKQNMVKHKKINSFIYDKIRSADMLSASTQKILEDNEKKLTTLKIKDENENQYMLHKYLYDEIVDEGKIIGFSQKLGMIFFKYLDEYNTKNKLIDSFFLTKYCDLVFSQLGKD